MSPKPRPGGARGASRRSALSSADRITPLFVLVSVALLAVAAKLAWVQTVEARPLSERAQKQSLREMLLNPRRGAILDREGEQLARTVDAKTIYAVPAAVKDATATAKAIARVLGGDESLYLGRLHRHSDFVYIARKVDLQRASVVEHLGIKGIGFLEDSRRTYPSNELACQVLGFVGVDDEGLAGLEKYYDDVLSGTPGKIVAERDPYGRIIPGGVVESEQPIEGRSIVLTIDKDIQNEADTALAEAVAQYGAKRGSVLVMDPRTGEIYALSSWPYFNPNSYSTAKPEALRNSVVCDAYEPGSTIKSFTAAAVIDRGLYTAQSMFDLPSRLRVGKWTIEEAHDRPAVRWSLAEIVTKSSNVGAVKLGLALGKESLFDYFSRFGLNERTGVDFPGEAAGFLPPPRKWSESSMYTIPFGQGISVTSLQLGRAYCALANGGALVTPHFLMQESGDDAERLWPTRPAVAPGTTQDVRAILADVVKDGTGKEAAVPKYDVAGKTGTAQKAQPGGLGYVKGAYVSSFAGFLPADDPRLMIIVTLDEPATGLYGGTVAAPSFARLAQFAVAHLKIPPPTKHLSLPSADNGGVSGRVTNGPNGKHMLESTSSVR